MHSDARSIKRVRQKTVNSVRHNYGVRRRRILPKLIKEKLTAETIALLERDNHGISFPFGDKGGLQMRLVRGGKNHGGYFNFKKYGGIEPAVKAAIARVDERRAIYPQVRVNKDHIQYACYEDKRSNISVYQYRVFYKKKGRWTSKTFSLGSKPPTAEQELHGYRTARLFEEMYREYGEAIVNHLSYFKHWRRKRLYQSGHPDFNWDGSGPDV